MKTIESYHSLKMTHHDHLSTCLHLVTCTAFTLYFTWCPTPQKTTGCAGAAVGASLILNCKVLILSVMSIEIHVVSFIMTESVSPICSIMIGNTAEFHCRRRFMIIKDSCNRYDQAFHTLKHSFCHWIWNVHSGFRGAAIGRAGGGCSLHTSHWLRVWSNRWLW